MGLPPTLCTHLAGALATSTRGRFLCIHDVYAKHMGTCTRRHRWRPQRDRVEDTARRTSVRPPRGRRNTSKSNSPDVQADARRTLLFPFSRDTRMSYSLTTFGATSVADAFTTNDLGKEKDSTHHLSSSARASFTDKKKKRKKTQMKVTEKLTSIFSCNIDN